MELSVYKIDGSESGKKVVLDEKATRGRVLTRPRTGAR